MNRAHFRTLKLVLAMAAAIGAMTFNDVSPTRTGFFTPQAHAIIGRPFTPLSFAGVARRTTRRAWLYGAAGATAGAVAYGAATAGSRCVQVVGVFGRLVVRCY